MKSFITAFLRRLALWWLPISLPWCVLFFGSGTHAEAESWLNEDNFHRALRAFIDGLLVTLPAGLLAAIAHTVALNRKVIFALRGAQRK